MAPSYLILLLWTLPFSRESTDPHRQLHTKLTPYPSGEPPKCNTLAIYEDTPSTIQCVSHCLETVHCLTCYHTMKKGLCVLCKLNVLPLLGHHSGALAVARFHVTVTDVCPTDEGYVHNPDLSLCIRLSNDTKTWWGAFDTCSLERAALFRPNSPAKITYIKHLIQSSSELKKRWYHLGASDAGHEGRWVWWNGEEVNGNVTDWITGSPDNYKGGQNCMALDPRSDHKWNDISCQTNIFHYICEKHMD